MKKLYRGISLWMFVAAVFILGSAGMVWAQGEVVPSTNEDVINAGKALADVIGQKGSVFLMVSLVLSFLMEVFKHKHLGALVYKIPFMNNPRVRFFLFPVTGALMGMFADLDGGSNWMNAIYGAVMLTLPAISAHQGWKAIRPASAKPDNPNK